MSSSTWARQADFASSEALTAAVRNAHTGSLTEATGSGNPT
jgi:hypothetical protein